MIRDSAHVREPVPLSRACVLAEPSCRLALPCLAAGGTCLCKYQPSLASLPEPLHRRRAVPSYLPYTSLADLLTLPALLTYSESLPASTSSTMPCPCYTVDQQCRTSLLQSSYNVHVSVSFYNVPSFQFPVPCLPACVPSRINLAPPPCYNHIVVPGHFHFPASPDSNSPFLALLGPAHS